MNLYRTKINGVDVLAFRRGGRRQITAEEMELFDVIEKASDLIERLAAALVDKKKIDKERITALYDEAYTLVEKEIKGQP